MGQGVTAVVGVGVACRGVVAVLECVVRVQLAFEGRGVAGLAGGCVRVRFGEAGAVGVECSNQATFRASVDVALP